MHDSRQVVGRHVVLDKRSRGGPDDLDPLKGRVEIVEHEHVETAVEFIVIADIGLGGCGPAPRLVWRADRHVDKREQLDILQHVVLEHLEVVGAEVADRVPVRVGDDGVHLDVVNLDLERDRRGFV